MRLVEHPGLSIVCIDPGGTTGVAVWDAWTKTLHTDAIDAGMGRKGRAWTHGGTELSPARRAAERELGIPWNKGINNVHVAHAIEKGVCRVLSVLVRALGPIGLVVQEDFVLWVGSKKQSGKREGLAPVRINTLLDSMLEDDGVFNGDAWRLWGGGWWTGSDARGVKVQGDGSIPPLAVRMACVKAWLEAGGELGGGSGQRKPAIWRGSGWKHLYSMPSTMAAAPDDEWMRANGMWTHGLKDANQAMRHLIVHSRKLGVEIKGPRNTIWGSKHVSAGTWVDR